ncbi:MAG TPA: sugar phosphate isomerase/epimerase [Firmicutes bacterium]|jgi:3-dehydroshikimate dehydratase|nr:sugar phosphate isomerase/epimerase [Bacillota bacterium]
MTAPIIMHVNYCEQGQTIEEMCLKAVKWGFDGIEFRRVRRGVAETMEEYLDAIAVAQRKSGLNYVLFGGPGPDLMTTDAAKREAALAECERFYTLAGERFNLTVCNVMSGGLRNPDPSVPASDYDRQGSFAAQEHHWQQAAEGYRRLGDIAAKYNYRLAFETHMNYLHDTPQATRKLVDLIDHPHVGINLDYGNAVYFKGMASLQETIRLCGDKLYYVHLKNSTANPGGGRIPTALSEGAINQREFVRLLKQHDYSGPICIEAPRPGDREWYAQQDLAYIKSVLADLVME